MRYLVLRNAIIFGSENYSPVDILIKNGKIVDIAPKILRPNTDSQIFDVEGKYIIPSFIDACSMFNTYSHDNLNNYIEMDIIKGISSWIAQESIQNIINSKIEATQSILNYGYHFTLKNLRINDTSHIRQLKTLYGIPTIFFQCKIDDINEFPKYIEIAQHYDLMLIINLASETIADMETMSTIINKLKSARCITMISNIRYKEEYEIIRNAANDNFHLHFNIADSESAALTDIGHDIINILLNNERASVMFKEYNIIQAFPNVLSKLISLDTEHILKQQQIKDYIVDRPSSILGLRPEKSNIALGCDGDLCVFDEKNNQIDALIINGKVIFDKNTEFSTVKGDFLFRRIL